MKINDEQMKALLNTVSKTSEQEVSCQACEDQLAQFAETQLTGQDIPSALKAIEAHLQICPECTEELQFIKRALEDEVG